MYYACSKASKQNVMFVPNSVSNISTSTLQLFRISIVAIQYVIFFVLNNNMTDLEMVNLAIVY